MTALGAFNPLDVTCPRCDEPPGSRCGTVNAYSRKPHMARVKLARALAAHADPALDALFPHRAQRRVVDAIAGMLAAGEDPETVAHEYVVSLEAVRAVEAWAQKWPGAWR